MSWDKRARGPQRGYFYRSVRMNGQPRKIYFGKGPEAEAAAAMLKRSHIARQDRRDERDRLAMAELALEQARHLTDLLAAAVLIGAGYHCHRGSWRHYRGNARATDTN